MSLRLDGKVALVTGGTSGIGAGAVRRLAADGARVAFTGSNAKAAARVCEETGATFHVHRVQDAPGWARLVDELLAAHGRMDVVFANAGVETGDGSIESIALEAWNGILDVNLTGVMLSARAGVAMMKRNPEGPRGSIIINSSMNANRAMGNYMAYSVTKSAVVALTKSVATHCGNQGYAIRCNAILPGVVETDMIRGVIDRAPDPAAARAQFEGMSPLRRMAQVEEIAALVAFLASDEATFISGSDYVIDGATTAGMSGV
jgi:3(or 17)beta-hydroxysteroid dehydrogenase